MTSAALLALTVLALVFWGISLGDGPLATQKKSVVAGSIVIASSARSLLTDPPTSFSFRLHVVLILVVAALMLLRVMRMKSA